ncbi:Inositol monophosphatase family protein [Histomonas meleagridis]|uniref:Inositol monophosphatase family protein n=1 Tax=Histomonas meleagridis TaxID=135588 RepID=UPI0035599684|nr:Inositol monophosphatase family protein [Histomonas meleagridis]KAH0802594.1 Inositol monophosphatase family protein [Histomonas meleagridis]
MESIFGEFAQDVEKMIEIIKPLISMSLNILNEMQTDQVQTKNDGTVVTICDFAIQSLIMDGISKKFPGDKVFGEEDYSKITPEFLSKVKHVLPENFDPVSACSTAIHYINPEDHRVWCIDPIDGTYGFINNGHFAIATALLVDLKLTLSVTAWPRHSSDITGYPIDGPAIFVSAKGHGSWIFGMDGTHHRVTLPSTITDGVLYAKPGRFAEFSPRIQFLADLLHTNNALRMVSMTKAFVLATGKFSVYGRFHNMEEFFWDVAPFELFLTEIGCNCTTLDGGPIEYTRDGKVANSKNGLVFTNKDKEFHELIRTKLTEYENNRSICSL